MKRQPAINCSNYSKNSARIKFSASDFSLYTTHPEIGKIYRLNGTNLHCTEKALSELLRDGIAALALHRLMTIYGRGDA